MDEFRAASNLSPEAQIIVLLCAHLPRAAMDSVEPLTTNEYQKLALWLEQNQLRPEHLFALESDEELCARLSGSGFEVERLEELLRRAGLMALKLEEWSGQGIWIRTRADDDYPRRLLETFGDKAPLLLFGAGEVSLLDSGGVAIVGSRRASQEALEATQRVAELCVGLGLTVISGGAKGVDSTATFASFNSGGEVVEVLAEGLIRRSRDRDVRNAIQARRLALLSFVMPEAGFSVGRAMARNRYIYGLADRAVVICADAETGGTWAGATENLKTLHRPLYVLNETWAPPGNTALAKHRGARAVTLDQLRRALESEANDLTPEPPVQLGFFDL